jgi:hypothetical protein
MTAGDMLTLNSAVSAAAGRTIVRYSWTQVSGTPLKLGSADGTAATVAWGTVKPTGIETAVIQLQVTDSTGDTDVARMAVMVGDSATAAQFLRLKREGGLGYRRPGPAYFYEPPGDQFYKTLYEPGRYTFREVLLGGNAAAHLVLVTPGAAPLAVGHYEQAGAIGLYNIFENPCAIHGGSYDVREVATAADGTFSRLAVDFTHICDGGIPVYGSYRRNSSVPLPD